MILLASSAWSHPVRGAWIEMVQATLDSYVGEVASRKGCVD